MKRIEREKRTVSLMIRLYCRKKEGNKTICSDCRELEKYAHKRLSGCKYGERRPPARNALRIATGRT